MLRSELKSKKTARRSVEKNAKGSGIKQDGDVKAVCRMKDKST